MNRIAFLSAAAWGAIALQSALGQTTPGQATPGPSLLNQAERLQPPTGAAASAAAAPAGGVYLGYMPIEGTDESRGIPVESVTPNAPAAQGGLRGGDLITAVNGKRMTLDQFDAFLRTASPGQKLQVTVERAGAPQQLTITLGSKLAAAPAATAPALSPPSESSFASPSLTPPASAPQTSSPQTSSPPTSAPPAGSFIAPSTVPDALAPSLSPPTAIEPLPGTGTSTPPASAEPAPRSIRAQPLDIGPPPGATAEPTDEPPPPSTASSPTEGGAGGEASLGVSVLPLSEGSRSSAGIPVRRGAIITSVRRGSPADQAGLPVNGVIVRMDDREVTSADDLVNAIKASQPGQEVEVTYYDGSRLYRKNVRLASAGGGPAATPGGPGLLRGAPGTLGNRPMLRNLGQMAADAIGRAPVTSTVYDPSVVAALQSRVTELTKQTEQLEERLRVLESRLGGSGATTPSPSAPYSLSLPSASSTVPSLTPPTSSPPAAPSFGPASGPGFGPALGGSGTTP